MPTKNGIYTSGASPSKDDGYEWMGGTALAMVLKKENAIVVAADRQLIRKRKRDQSTYEDGGYETIPFQAELQYIHQLDNNTGCVVVGQRPIANSWFGYLDAKLSSKGGSSNMYKSKNKVNAESNNTLLASLQHLSDFQKDHFNAKETASEVLLVGWNEQAEPSLYYINHAGPKEIKDGVYMVGRGWWDTVTTLEAYDPDMRTSDAKELAEKALFISHTLKTSGIGMDVWTLKPGGISKKSQRMENLNHKHADV